LSDNMILSGKLLTKSKISSMLETALTSDTIIFKQLPKLYEQPTIQDTITPLGILNIHSLDETDTLRDGATYTITPNPFGGIIPLTVQDGGVDDSDGIDNGRITIRSVPFDVYTINSTEVPDFYTPLINFTHVTVHGTNTNATGLFPLVKTINDFTMINATNSDIVDIQDPARFDALISSADLFKVRNNQAIQISRTSELPAPIFAGVNNATALAHALATQYSMLYENVAGLNSNALPEDITSTFNLTTYDGGNSTDATFVGVMTATEESTFGQYIATQPVDKFNCGQQYVFPLDNSTVPSFGGLTNVTFTISQTATCVEGKDYNTFEVNSTPDR